MEVGVELEDATSENCEIKMDLTRLLDSCRVCMAQSLNMNCIFETPRENIVHEIQYCTGILLMPEDGLPTQICDLCLTHLSVAYKFKKSCLTADNTFRNLLLSSPIKAEGPHHDLEYEEIIEYADDTVEIEERLNEIDAVLQNKVKKNNRDKLKKPPPVKGRPKKTSKLPAALKHPKKFKNSCEPCNMKFQTKLQSDEHKRKVHNETWVCEICGKVFLHRASHYTHVKSHQPPKYACDHCGYKTWHKYDLVKHIRIHTGNKMYQCEYCTASFYTSSNLASHIRRKHKYDRPHECHTCSRTFADRTKLNMHLDTHLAIKRFRCDICHTFFARRCYLKRHLLSQHDIVSPPVRPGRQKINLVVGECLINRKLEDINDLYANGCAANKKF